MPLLLLTLLFVARHAGAPAPSECRAAPDCQEDINCPDVPQHAGRPHEDVFATECGTKVSQLWAGAPPVELGTLCP
eukprot:COSAG06_NODE_39030_length_417_cov_0.814465_1_plen_75_part_01